MKPLHTDVIRAFGNILTAAVFSKNKIVQVLFNPKDTNTFASASLDRTVKVLYFLDQNPEAAMYFGC